jgi:hypothetical protein
MYFHLLGAAGPMVGSIYYRKSEGWEYFYEISREAYRKHVPPIVFEQLENDKHPLEYEPAHLIAHT